MSKTYKVRVNDNFVYDFDESEIGESDILEFSPNQFHVLDNHRSFQGKITHEDFLKREYEVQINSNHYKINIANDLDLLIEKMGLELTSAQKADKIHAPMPGLILEINVKEGQEVKEGDYVIVLEAMKMENALTAPKNGVVKAIKVKQNDTVNKGDLLIEFE